MKLRFFGPGGRVWRLIFQIKHLIKLLKHRRLHKIGGVKTRAFISM